jgi:hypothetical protein
VESSTIRSRSCSYASASRLAGVRRSPPVISLAHAQLQGASLDLAELQGASLEQAQLQGASLERAQLQGASLGGTHLQGASYARHSFRPPNYILHLYGEWIFGTLMRRRLASSRQKRRLNTKVWIVPLGKLAAGPRLHFAALTGLSMMTCRAITGVKKL